MPHFLVYVKTSVFLTLL